MNYSKIYGQIICKAFNEDRQRSDAYYEQHHILPKCLGGTNDADNLILLTAREHFICHKLLVELYPGSKKMVYALWMMVYIKRNKRGNHERNYKVSSREYERLKINRRKYCSGENHPMHYRTGENHPNWGKHFIVPESKKLHNTLIHKGKTISETHKQCIRESNTGKHFTWSEEAKVLLKIIVASRTVQICPHCHYASNNRGVMGHYHFDKCKTIQIREVK